MKSITEKNIYKNYFFGKEKNLLRYGWYINKFFKGIKKKKILEIGCGDGGLIKSLNVNNAVYGIDVSESGVKNVNSMNIKCDFLDVSVDKLPYRNRFFDYVIILEVFEHLKSPYFTLEEIQRVLKTDGKLLISIPNYRNGHKLLYPSLFKFRFFRHFLEHLGFRVDRIEYYGFCPPFWKIFKSSVIKINKKNKNKKGVETGFFSRLAFITSTGIFRIIKPKIFAWSFIYMCSNKNPNRAKKLFFEIAKDTSGAY